MFLNITSRSLCGVVRVNPWNRNSVAEAMESAFTIQDNEKQLRHEEHYRFVSTHAVAFWARSFLQDLERACREHVKRRCWGIGFGLGFRVVALDPSFRKLSSEHIVSAYKRTKNRAILLDCDGTMMVQSSVSSNPNAEAVSVLNSLSRDPKNVVFLVSGKDRTKLDEWFSSCKNLGIAAEHGYFVRDDNDAEWETCRPITNVILKQIYQHQLNKQMSCPTMAQLLSNTLYYKHFFPYFAFNVLGGLDNEGKGCVYTYDAVGSYEKVGYRAQGSGAKLIKPFLDNQLKSPSPLVLPVLDAVTPLAEAEAIDLLKTVFASATERDIYTGDKLEIVVLNKEGLRRDYMDLRKD